METSNWILYFTESGIGIIDSSTGEVISDGLLDSLGNTLVDSNGITLTDSQ